MFEIFFTIDVKFNSALVSQRSKRVEAIQGHVTWLFAGVPQSEKKINKLFDVFGLERKLSMISVQNYSKL
jgi:hypothetical protein